MKGLSLSLLRGIVLVVVVFAFAAAAEARQSVQKTKTTKNSILFTQLEGQHWAYCSKHDFEHYVWPRATYAFYMAKLRREGLASLMPKAAEVAAKQPASKAAVKAEKKTIEALKPGVAKSERIAPKAEKPRRDITATAGFRKFASELPQLLQSPCIQNLSFRNMVQIAGRHYSGTSFTPVIHLAQGFQESSCLDKINPISGARGPWQFLPSTGRGFGLVDKNGDRRGDPEASTEASARYMNELIERYKGNIMNALAAYFVGMKYVDPFTERGGRIPRGSQAYYARRFEAGLRYSNVIRSRAMQFALLLGSDKEIGPNLLAKLPESYHELYYEKNPVGSSSTSPATGGYSTVDASRKRCVSCVEGSMGNLKR